MTPPTDFEMIQRVALRVRKRGLALRRNTRVSGKVVSPDLCGMCACLSAMLFRSLKRKKMPARLAMYDEGTRGDHGHVYVLCAGYIVDVTATQYGKNMRAVEIVLDDVDARNRLPYWDYNYTFDSVRALVKCQRLLRWPDDQLAVVRPSSPAPSACNHCGETSSSLKRRRTFSRDCATSSSLPLPGEFAHGARDSTTCVATL